MSALSFLFNCIIFLVGFQEILSTTIALPAGYHYTPGIGMHKLHTTALTWDNARRTCIEERGHLAIINSVAEENVLKDLFQQAGPITGTDDNHKAFIGQPNNWNNNQQCGALLKNGGVDNTDCNKPFAFFCELPFPNDGYTYK